MNDMKDVPVETLVLCHQEMTGFCLRSFDADGCAWNENHDFDDSELKFFGWWPLPGDAE